MTNTGQQYSEVMNMETTFGRQCIEWKTKQDYDLRMMDKVDFLSVHGVDVRSPSKCGTDIYINWINEKQKERFDELEKKMGDKLKREVPIDKDIDNIIVAKRLKAQNGK